jgi:surfeit locus 1 family protein
MKLIRLGPIVFRISLLPAIAFIGLLPILVALGFWQLDRAEAKTALLELQEQRMEAETLELTGQNGSAPEDLRYRHAEATGQYDGAHQFLIDNQVLNGRAGYFVLTPLKIRGSATALLVNRGWVPANADRTLLPDVAIAPQTVTVSGRINHFPVVGIKLAGSEIGETARISAI